MSATATVDRKKYVRLANRVIVKAIETEEEYDWMVTAVEALMEKGEEHRSPEEDALLETMAILIQAYDDRLHALSAVPGHEMLSYLMESSGRKATELLPIFGTRGRVSEVLSGKRSHQQGAGKEASDVFQSHGGPVHLVPPAFPDSVAL